MMISRKMVRDFIFESNEIEGIVRAAKMSEIEAHERLWSSQVLRVSGLIEFVHIVAAAPLRRELGQDVQVGRHVAPFGGPDIVEQLDALLRDITADAISPHEGHVRYETLHPFMDGNGRSGRAVWAWHKLKRYEDPFGLGFLHAWYYESLDATRRMA